MADRLKDQFFTPLSVQAFTDRLKRTYPDMDRDSFLNTVLDDEWEARELKQRMRHMSACLASVLPDDFGDAVQILEDIAPDITGFEAMVLPDYVEVHGLQHIDRSLQALRVFTRYSSSEFAIRPYIIADQDRAMKFMLSCAEDDHENVRRFASEGCRPRLPWAMALPALKKDPSPIFPVLERLKDDSSDFVRRSVANNLNDISKDHPDLVLNLAEEWYGFSESTDKIVKHALRSLLKAGNTRALRLFGFGDPAGLVIDELKADTHQIRIGDSLHFTFRLRVKEKESTLVRLEYAIHYVKAKGKRSRKVFQITENRFDPGSHEVRRKQSFANMTTRKHYPGLHTLEVIVNGIVQAAFDFELAEE